MTAVIALTGGVASGKTAVSDRFAELGVPIIDTDIIAREVVAPGQAALKRVIERFGNGVLLEDGSLDRVLLRSRIFAEPEERRALEAILHPAILKEVQARLAQLTDPFCVVVIPLLAENSVHDWIDRVLVVDCSESLQLQRLLKRDGVSLEQAQAMLKAQASRMGRLAIADDVILNDGTLKELIANTDQLCGQYKKKYAQPSTHQ